MSLNAEKLKVFFQTNDKIENLIFSLYFDVNEDYATDRDYHTIPSIETLDYAKNLQRLLLSASEPLTKCFGDICSHLNRLCARDKQFI